MAKAKSPIPPGHHTVTPQLVLDEAARAIDWYKKALGADEHARAVEDSSGCPIRQRAVECQIADARGG